MFVDGPGLQCNTGGKSCSGHGSCDTSSDFGGCVCEDGSALDPPEAKWFGEYCQYFFDPLASGARPRLSAARLAFTAGLTLAVALRLLG